MHGGMAGSLRHECGSSDHFLRGLRNFPGWSACSHTCLSESEIGFCDSDGSGAYDVCGCRYVNCPRGSFFESLIRADKWVWLFGWTFHVALAVVLMRHLFFFTDPVWRWVLWILPFGDYAAWGLIIALLGL